MKKMEHAHGSCKASKFAQKDVISHMPDEVVTNILHCLPLQDAVKTGILSSYWRSKWTMITQLVFDEDFYQYLQEREKETYYGKIISRLLLHLNGAITRFDLYIPEDENVLDAEDINNWVMSLSRKGIKEFTLINMPETPLNLHTYVFSCLKLKHLKLYNCYFCPMSSFRGFPNLLSLDLCEVTFESYKCGEFLTRCPLLEILTLSNNTPGEITLLEIAKLENLKVLSLPMLELDNMSMITSSTISQLTGLFPKLQELTLDFLNCELVKDATKRVPTSLPCLKTLSLYNIDFKSDTMVSCAIELICGSPYMKTLVIIGIDDSAVPLPPVCSSELDCRKMGHLRLQKVVLHSIRGLENEVCLIKYLLACSPFLKKMVIHSNSTQRFRGDCGELMVTKMLLKLHLASPTAKIDLY